MDKRWARLFGISDKCDVSDITRLTFGGNVLPLDKVIIARDERGSAEFAWLRFVDETAKNAYIDQLCDDDPRLMLTN